jgi:putative hemolysin
MATRALSLPAASLHIVDALIEERAQGLMSRPWLWPLVKAVFYPLLGYRKAVAVADTLAPLGGREAMDWASGFLGMTTAASGVEQVPASGPAVVVANHPGGIADGIAVWDALKTRRPDLVYFANRDALRVCAGLASLVIPVEWRVEERSREKTRETLRQTIEAFKAGRCVVVFPAGRMAEWKWSRHGLVERAWAPTAVSLARKFAAPIVPLGVAQRLSLAYYSLAQVSEELKNMTVFHELLAKKGARYRLRFGAPLDPDALEGDDAEATETLRALCQELAWDWE